ncbi:uncharacterized protein [Eurosta solidaginis]|uniref:uncharacterized protein n=1 Tax=Eurosta solidaginis TaxID=178769 RepID=UPI0035317A25
MLLNKCKLKAIFFVHIVIIIYLVSGELYRECDGDDKNQKFVVSYENCAKYIYCDGDYSFDGECLGDYYFNIKAGKCDEPSAVVCSIDKPTEVTSGTDSKENSDSQSDLETQVVALDGAHLKQNISNINDIKNTNNKNNINKNAPNNPNNNINIKLNALVAQQQVKKQPPKSAVFGEIVTGLALSAIDMGYTGANIATYALPPRCPLRYGSDNISYLPNTQSCSSYYTCYNGIAIPMICPQYTYFNQTLSRCERQLNPYCPYHQQVRLICNPGVFDYIPHSRNCSYYYYCSNGYLIILQCPLHFTWHYERRSCVHRSQAKCFTHATAQTMVN